MYAGETGTLEARDSAAEWEKLDVMVKQGEKLETASEYYSRLALQGKQNRMKEYDDAAVARLAEKMSALNAARASAEAVVDEENK